MPATSSGWPTRRSGTCAETASMNCSNGTPMRSAVCCVIAVAMKPGRDAVDVDVERAELDRERLRHPLQPRLRGRVVRLAAVAERGGRGDQHHLPGLLLDHLLLRGAHRVERSLQVRVDDGVPVLVAHLEEHVVADDPGARDEDVERAAVRDRGLDRGLDVLALRHVAANGVTADRRRRLLRRRLVEVGDDDRRPLATRAASPSRRRCPSRRRSPAPSSPRISCGRPYTVARMEFRDILARRRMHRAFLPDPLPREQIERIANVIRRAPSGGFSQGGSIVVVTDDEQAARDRRCVRRRALLARRPQLHRRRAGAHGHLRERVALPRPLQRARQARGDGRRRGDVARSVLVRRRRRADDARAAAAIDEGLASAFIGHPDQKRIFDELLGLPEDVVPIGLALIGKRGRRSAAPARA